MMAVNYKLWKDARKISGLARYERTNRTKTMEGWRLKLSYNVPGTKQAGEIHMLRMHANDVYTILQVENPDEGTSFERRSLLQAKKRADKAGE